MRSMAPLYLGSLAAIALVVVVVRQSKREPAQPPRMVAAVAPPQALPSPTDGPGHLRACQMFSDTKGDKVDWRRAVDECQAALDLTPLNHDARERKERALFELAQQAVAARGHEMLSQGHEEAAIDELLKVDHQAQAFTSASADFKLAVAAASRKAAESCTRLHTAQDDESAWPVCRHYEDFAALGASDPQAQAVFDALQIKFGKRDPWSLPPKFAALRPTQPEAPTVTITPVNRAIRAQYPDAALADAVAAYEQDPRRGRDALQALRQNGSNSRVEKLLVALGNAAATHTLVQERLLKLDVAGAAKALAREQLSDRTLMPPRFESQMLMRDRDAVANKAAEQGMLALRGRDYDTTFRGCMQGYAVSQTNFNVISCLAVIETYVASNPMNSCASAQRATELTRHESPLHTKADAFRASHHCR